ncbi:hypothetical protein Droror1_Dr00007504 [Drosera rotundifolia]
MAAASLSLKPLNPFAQEFHPAPAAAVIATPTLNPCASPWPYHHHPQSFSQYPLAFQHYHAASVYYTHNHHAAYYISYPPPSTQQPSATTTNTATTNTFSYSTDFDLQALRPPPPPSPPPHKTPNPNFFSSKRSNVGDARQELKKPWVNGGDLTGKVKFSWKGGFRLSTSGGPVSSVDYFGGGGERSPPTSAGFKRPSSRRRRPCEHRSAGFRRSLSPVVRSYYERMGKRKVKSELIPVKEDGEETTVMIRNIPNQYSREDLIEFLDEYCRRENEYIIETQINEAADAAEREEVKTSPEFAYDFVYLPIDFGTHVNRGFAFVNFTSPIAVKKLQLYNSANPWWEKCDSDKLRDIACAKIQGKRALVDHFDKSVFSCCSDKYLPLFYNPPRDGSSRQVSQRTIGQWIRTTKPPSS